MTSVAVGQIWESADPRGQASKLRVLSLVGSPPSRAVCERVRMGSSRDGLPWVAWTQENGKPRKHVTVLLKRFNGSQGGYRLTEASK